MKKRLGGVTAKKKSGRIWVIGVSAPAVVTGIYLLDAKNPARCYSVSLSYTFF